MSCLISLNLLAIDLVISDSEDIQYVLNLVCFTDLSSCYLQKIIFICVQRTISRHVNHTHFNHTHLDIIECFEGSNDT